MRSFDSAKDPRLTARLAYTFGQGRAGIRLINFVSQNQSLTDLIFVIGIRDFALLNSRKAI